MHSIYTYFSAQKQAGDLLNGQTEFVAWIPHLDR